MNHDFMNNIPKNGVAADVRRRISIQYHAFVRLLTSAAATLAVAYACQGQSTNATGVSGGQVASAAEELASTAQEMAAQAAGLLQLMDFFRVEQGAAA